VRGRLGFCFGVFGCFCIRLFEYGVYATACTPFVNIHSGPVTVFFGDFDVRGLVGPAIVRKLHGWTISAHATLFASFAETIAISSAN
jgi:hypothetical protein